MDHGARERVAGGDGLCHLEGPVDLPLGALDVALLLEIAGKIVA
jgi:hypothetical protein